MPALQIHHRSQPQAEKIRREAASTTSLEAWNPPSLVADVRHATMVQRTLRTA